MVTAAKVSGGGRAAMVTGGGRLPAVTGREHSAMLLAAATRAAMVATPHGRRGHGWRRWHGHGWRRWRGHGWRWWLNGAAAHRLVTEAPVVPGGAGW